MARRVLKWNVPVDDERHYVGSGPVVHVACQGVPGFVQVWTDEHGGTGDAARLVQVYGTGHAVPDDATYLGTTLAGSFVWHLFETP